MITSECVDQVCSEVDGYSDDRMMQEFESFFQEQPSICDFITELTVESSPMIQGLSMFLSYMVFKAVKKGSPDAVSPVAPESVEAAFKESEKWIDRIADQGQPSEIPVEAEPHLLEYVISELNQPLEDGTLLEDEQKGEVFFTLKTVISSLTRSPIGKET